MLVLNVLMLCIVLYFHYRVLLQQSLFPYNTLKISTNVNSAEYESGTYDENDIDSLIDGPDAGVTNNTSEAICVPIATKEIEKDDGTKETLLEKSDLNNDGSVTEDDINFLLNLILN